MASIKKNFSLNFIYQLLNIGIALVTIPYISNVLGAENSGIYSYHYSIVKYFLLFAMLGIENYGNRCIAFARDDINARSKVFSEVYTMQLIATAVTCAAYLGYTFLLGEDLMMAILLMLFLIAAFFDVNWFFFGMEKFSITVTRNIIIKCTLTLGIFLFVRDRGDLYIYTLLMALSQLLSTLAIMPFLRRYVTYRLPAWRALKQHMKPMLVLFVPVLAVSVYTIMDKVMLGMMSTKAQVGYYDYSEKVMLIPHAFIMAAGTVMLPRISHMAQNNEKSEVLKFIEKSMEVVLFFSIGMACGIVGIAYNLIPVFLGEEYLSCILLVQMLTPIIVMKAWSNVIRTQYLIPYCRDKIFVISVILGAVVNVTANCLLIPGMNALGAIIGTVLAEMTVMVVQSIGVRNELQLGRYLLQSIKYLVPGVVMLVVLELLNSQLGQGILALLCDLIVGVVIYFAGAAVLNYKRCKAFLSKRNKK